jgi:hypothetical protein
MKKRNKRKLLIILSFFLFLLPTYIKAAGSAITNFSGNNSVYLGSNIDITLYITESGTGGIAAIQGKLNYDTSKLQLVNSQSLAPFSISINNGTIGGMDTTGSNAIKGRRNLMKFTFKAIGLGKTTINFNGTRQPNINGETVATTNYGKTITITNPPSSNNNLSKLSVIPGGISFNPSTTSYTTYVESNVTSVTISATAADGGARIAGVGSKNLNYGNNRFEVVVTAPNGAKKSYVVNVNRKDSRSNNNKLSSLTVQGGTLEPKFSPHTETYSLLVPFETSELNVVAKPEDSKAKVSVTNKVLVAEETTAVKVLVTAENGSKKTYTINTTRGKDPNKILSSNNYLSSLTVSTGILSPVFNKEQEQYVVYLPFEIDKIEIVAVPEDTKYATVEKEMPSSLTVGNNLFKYSVKAEDSSTRVYSVVVVRGKNLLEGNLSNNSFLKEINIKQGKLIGKYSKEKNLYKYNRRKGFEIEVVPEELESKTTIIDNNAVISILVEAPNGEVGVYTLVKNEKPIIKYLTYFLFLIGGTGAGILLSKGNLNILNKHNKEKKKTKKR